MTATRNGFIAERQRMTARKDRAYRFARIVFWFTVLVGAACWVVWAIPHV